MKRLWTVLLAAAAIWASLWAFVPSARQGLVFYGSTDERFCDFMFPRECAAAERTYRPETIGRLDACYPPLGYAVVSLFPRDKRVGGPLFAAVASALLAGSIFLCARGRMIDRIGWAATSLVCQQALLAIGVANQVLLAAAGVGVFFAFEKRSGWRGALALCALAFAAALKVAPALFSLLLIRDRRWRDFAVFATLAALLAFVPFVWCGGFGAVPDFIENLRLHSGYYTARDAWGFVAVGRPLALALGWTMDQFARACFPFRMANVVLGLIAAGLFFWNAKRPFASDAVLLALSVTLLPGCQQGYTALYFLPAAVMLTSGRLTLGHFLFLAMFCPIQVPVGSFVANHLVAAVAALALLGSAGGRAIRALALERGAEES